MRLKNIIIFLCAIIMFSACSSQKVDKTIKVGHCVWPGYEPLVLASEKGFFKTPVKVIRFSSPQKAYKAFKNGAVDIVALTTDELIKYADYGTPPKIFLILDVSNGADAIVGHKDLKIEELKGKSVALESSILGKYMLTRFLEKNNISKDDVHIKNIEIVDQPNAYAKHEADFFVTFEPSKTQILNNDGKVFFDSSDIPNEIVDALAANQQTWQQYPEVIKDIQQGWFKALAYIQSNQQDAYTLMGGYEQTDAKSFEASLEGIKLGDENLNNELIKERKLIPILTKIDRVLRDEGILQNTINLDTFIEK